MNPAPQSSGESPAAAAPGGKHSCGSRARLRLILGFGVALIIGVWFFLEPLRARIFDRGVLANDAPTDEQLQEVMKHASDPGGALLAEWNTGKIAPRRLAIQKMNSVIAPGQPLSAPLRAMLLAAALDPDLDVREIAMSALAERNDPGFAPLCAAQLEDLDPEVRLLGLMHMKKLPAEVGVPLVAPLLAETNLQVLAYAVKLLEGWSGGDFGLKLGDAVPVEDAKTGLLGFEDESYVKTRAGVDRAAAWWDQHKAQFHPVRLEIPSEALRAVKPIYAGDFTLPGMDGKPVRLSDFRGKAVLINFWTTWCTACVGEMPELIALQKNHNDQLSILGVSLDAVPDDDAPEPLPSLEAIRAKVARTVKLRGINYDIALDEKNSVGSRFNGGELPTTMIVDAQGRIRRRFVGTRSLSVFEAMIAEAIGPSPAAPFQSAQQSAPARRE